MFKNFICLPLAGLFLYLIPLAGQTDTMEEDFIIALQEFSDKKEELYRIIQEFGPISDKGKKDMIRYMDEFYKLFNDRNAIVKVLLKECRDI